ncbi:MAG: polysaccharide deacetylase family protein [bacterium]|nr:polysaccharide deacetylase family protein [bacterium]
MFSSNQRESIHIMKTIIWTILGVLLVSPSTFADEPAFEFPEGKQCAVTISIDDGFWDSASQMADLLDKYRLKASFNLITSWVKPMKTGEITDSYNEGADHGTWPQWKTLLDRGYEIGSHTCTHPALPTIDPEAYEKEISDSKRALIDNLGVAEPVTFAFPYNQSSPEVKAVVEKYYAAARVGGKIFNQPGELDLYNVQSWWPYSDTPLEEIVAKIDEAEAKGYWLVIGLHGMNEEGWHPIAPEKFEGMLKRLANDDAIWTATFKDAAHWFETHPVQQPEK